MNLEYNRESPPEFGDDEEGTNYEDYNEKEDQ